jgi:hypothetical protein
VKYVTLEYGLYEERWWMPRYVAIDASGAMGSWLGVPVRIERVYEDYEVEGGTPRAEGVTFRPAGTVERRDDEPRPDSVERRRTADSVRTARRACIDLARRDSPDGAEGRRARRARMRDCTRRAGDSSLVVIIPEDTLSLLTSAELGAPILDMGDLIDEGDLRAFRDALGTLPQAPWDRRLELPRGVSSALRHARYNRVEALSLGLGARLDLGRLAIAGTARLGAADLVPNGELAISRRTPNAHVGLGAYRRLAARIRRCGRSAW